MFRSKDLVSYQYFPGSNYVKQETVQDPKEENSSLTYYCHFGDIADPRLRAILDLVVHIMREPCFSQLRTKEQLGLVSCFPEDLLLTKMT